MAPGGVHGWKTVGWQCLTQGAPSLYSRPFFKRGCRFVCAPGDTHPGLNGKEESISADY